jgi:cell division protein FtsZ
VNVDFADVRTIMSRMGRAVMGVGIARGDNRAVEAAQRAISSPLLEDGSIDGAQAVLINVTCGPDLALQEANEAANIVQKAVAEDAQIIWGTVIARAAGGHHHHRRHGLRAEGGPDAGAPVDADGRRAPRRRITTSRPSNATTPEKRSSAGFQPRQRASPTAPISTSRHFEAPG